MTRWERIHYALWILSRMFRLEVEFGKHPDSPFDPLMIWAWTPLGGFTFEYWWPAWDRLEYETAIRFVVLPNPQVFKLEYRGACGFLYRWVWRRTDKELK